MARRELPPQRLGPWLERWAARAGTVAHTRIEPASVCFAAAGGAALRCTPPFGPLEPAPRVLAGFVAEPLLEHVARERTVGVLLVRLGGHAAGVFEGARLIESKVGRRLVHGRHRAGGSSSGRFARRRENQARAALQAAADSAARVLLPAARDGRLEAVVLGGDRRALATVLADARLAPVAALAGERILEVPDPRLEILRATPERFLATVVDEVG